MFEDQGDPSCPILDSDWTCSLKKDTTCADEPITDSSGAESVGILQIFNNIITVDTFGTAVDTNAAYCYQCIHNTYGIVAEYPTHDTDIRDDCAGGDIFTSVSPPTLIGT